MELSPEEKQQIYAEEKVRLEAQERANKEVSAKKTRQGCLGFIVLIALLALLAGLFSLFGPNEPDPEAQARNEKIEAYVAAKKFVEDRLKAPATAKFPWYNDDFVSIRDDGNYAVTAYVDAENSFGANIRTVFNLILRDAGNNQWQLVDIEIE